MNSGIYCIKNINNNKLYIGSSRNLSDRKSKHFYKLKTQQHTNKHLQNAYNLYGKDSFIFHVLEEVEDISQLAEVENWWISNLPREELYNIRQEAESNAGLSHTEEVRRRLSKAHTGMIRSKEHREAIGNAQRGVKKNRKEEPNQVDKPVCQIDLATGDVVKTWISISKAAKSLGIDRSGIVKVCKGKRKSTAGYGWRYNH